MPWEYVTYFRCNYSERERTKIKKGRGRGGDGRKERGGRRRGREVKAELWYIVRNCA